MRIPDTAEVVQSWTSEVEPPSYLLPMLIVGIGIATLAILGTIKSDRLG